MNGTLKFKLEDGTRKEIRFEGLPDLSYLDFFFVKYDDVELIITGYQSYCLVVAVLCLANKI